MDYSTYQNFLRNIAQEVDSMARSPHVKACFVKHIKQFINMCNTHDAAARKLASSGIDQKRYATADELPPTPEFWFDGYGLLNFDTNTFGSIITSASKTRQPDEDEKLMCQYVRLSVIHDWICTSPTDTAIYFQDKTSTDSQICEIVWQKLSSFLDLDDINNSGVKGRQNEKRLTEQALEVVKKDLEKVDDIADAKQKSTSVNLDIRSFPWKLYEKTLKVIVDAVIEKCWPK